MVKRLTTLILILFPLLASSETLKVTVFSVDEKGFDQNLGEVTIEETNWGGTLITPNLKNLPAGVHGFHLHDKGDCSAAEKDGKMVPALAAGGHYDPDKTNKHEGPYGQGHMGDMPVLNVDSDGTATLPVYAPRLKPVDFRGRAVIVHAGGDNYQDTPAVLGGGGGRIACGIAKPLILCTQEKAC